MAQTVNLLLRPDERTLLTAVLEIAITFKSTFNAPGSSTQGINPPTLMPSLSGSCRLPLTVRANGISIESGPFLHADAGSCSRADWHMSPRSGTLSVA